MTVTRKRRGVARGAAISLAALVVGACGASDSTDGPAATAPGTAATTAVEAAPTPTEPPATEPPATVLPATELPATEPPTEPSVVDGAPTVVDVASLPSMEAVASLGYPRDLLERGRINLDISRADDTEFVVLDKQLVAAFFAPPPVEARRTVLPPNGQVVSLQTLFGEVSDCDDPGLVTAVVHLTFTYGDDPTVRSVTVPLTDTTTLDMIRAQQCTVIAVLRDNAIELVDPIVDGETMTVDLVITRTSGDALLAIDSIKGTVLFGAESEFEPGSPERTLLPGQTTLTIPLDFDVNRCDSHAVAETTKKFGLDIYVGVDGAESQRIDVPIDAIQPQLETMLDRCKERTGP